MKKQIISFSILFALTLSTVQPLAAVSFKEWAQSYMKKFSPQQIKAKAIAAAQKLKGLKAKDAWNKINFMGRAIRELDAAQKALDICESKHCPVQQNAAKDALKAMRKCQSRYGCWSLQKEWQNADATVRRCHQSACPAEYKAFKQADIGLAKSTSALLGIIITAYLGIGIGVGTAVYLDEKEQAKRAQEEAVRMPQEPKWSKPSPVYEKPDPEFEELTRSMKEAGLSTQ